MKASPRVAISLLGANVVPQWRSAVSYLPSVIIALVAVVAGCFVVLGLYGFASGFTARLVVEIRKLRESGPLTRQDGLDLLGATAVVVVVLVLLAASAIGVGNLMGAWGRGFGIAVATGCGGYAAWLAIACRFRMLRSRASGGYWPGHHD